MSRTRMSRGFTLFIIIIIIYSVMWFAVDGESNVITSDGTMYYQYFTRAFISHNIADSGIIKFPVGSTLLQLPFLLIGLALSGITGTEIADGFNIYFQAMVFTAGLFYGVCAFILIHRMLRRRYSEKASLLACVALMCGTMIPVYMMEHASFSHIYGFFICSATMCYVEYYEKKRAEPKNATVRDLFLGALLGFSALIRNTNIIISTVYVFYNVTSFGGLRNRLKEVFSRRIIPQIIGAAAILSIQFILWRIMSGHWVLYSYTGEHFLYLTDPRILQVLFSDAKGLFFYSPILFVGLLSMLFFRSENKEFRLAQWIVFLGLTYLVSAWWCWWLGGAYGERMYCDILCIFAIPLASFFESLRNWSQQLRHDRRIFTLQFIPMLCYIAVTLMIAVNIIWIKGTRSGVVSSNMSNWYELKSWLNSFLFK